MPQSRSRYSICVFLGAVLFILDGSNPQPLAAQPITPANDGTNTQILLNGDRINIQGGTLSTDGRNLFHSFEQFNLDANQTANFLANPQLRNILGRIVGGDPSLINGLLQISNGTPNLYLMNPAGIVFGQNARLNVPADFTATTATGINFSNGVFNLTDPINPALNGSPTAFDFANPNPGAIINAGDLSVGENANLNLSGGTVINTGNISTSGGDINLVSVPGSSRLQLSQDGTILRLEIDPPRNSNGNLLGFRPLDLPALLTGPAATLDTNLSVTPAGEVQLTASQTTLPNLPGTTVVTQNLDSRNANQAAGDITVLGQNIALFDANLEASGTNPGTIRIGGDYLGQDDLPTAQRTLIDAQTTLNSNGLNGNNGGQVIVWADDVTGFAGTIEAHGGEGGFVEVSGKETLVFRGFVDVGDGTILLDPRNITISNAASTAGVNASLPNIFITDFSNQDITINRADLEALNGSIVLQADNTITLPSNVSLSLTSNNNSLTLQASSLNLRGKIVVSNNVTLTGNSIDIASLEGGGILFIETRTADRNIAVGGTISTPSLDLSTPDLNAIRGFQALVIGRDDNSNNVTLRDNVNFNIPTIIRANSLTGPNSNTTWTLTDSNSGTISGFDNTVTFNNVNTINAGSRQDRFVFNNNVTFNGTINGGNGTDTLDYSNYRQSVDFDLANPSISNIEEVIGPSAYANTIRANDNPNDWQIQGTNRGSVNGIDFVNFNNLMGGSDRDTFTFANNARVNGIIDGDPGLDTLDYQAYQSPVVIDLANNQATGTQGAFNIENGIFPTVTNLDPKRVTNTVPHDILNSVQSQNLNTPSPNNNLNIPNNSPSLPSNTTATELNIDLVNRETVNQLLDENDLKDAIVALDNLFSSAFAEYLGQNIPGSPLTYSQIQGKIQDVAEETGTQPAIIYTFIRPESLDLILVPPSGDPQHYEIESATPAKLQAVIEDFQFNLLHPTRRRSTQYLDSAQQLYNWIIAPLKSDLENLGIDTLLFSLDTGLRTLPLAALHSGDRFLIEDYRLSIIPSLTWAEFEYTDNPEGTVTAMGMSEFIDQKALPAVQTELAAIASDFSSEVFFNETFTFENLEQQTQQPGVNIVHLATHGQFLPGKAENSYIQLWDRKLTLPQMGNLEWGNSGINLLVLSACRTALGEEGAEYGFAGLGIQTGVDSVLASLWYASDTGTLALMSEFYDRLDARALKSEALRQAQLALMRGQVEIEGDRLIGPFGEMPLPEALANVGDRDFSHPYYWAGFSLIGSPW
ncbi:MAG: CHAT domain-containing protein [Spirulinaceae cyanobacterium]